MGNIKGKGLWSFKALLVDSNEETSDRERQEETKIKRADECSALVVEGT